MATFSLRPGHVLVLASMTTGPAHRQMSSTDEEEEKNREPSLGSRARIRTRSRAGRLYCYT